MRDHVKIVGTLFIAWAVVQAAAALAFAATGMPATTRTVRVLFWFLVVVVVAAFGWTGVHLRRHASRARVPAIVMSALALLSFPAGTALGVYGLWALFPRRRAAAHAP